MREQKPLIRHALIGGLVATSVFAFPSAASAAGKFDAPVTFGTVTEPQSMVAGDFNGDGHSDLAAAGTGGLVYVLLGDGAGGFSAAGTYASGTNPYGLAAGDLDGDGDLDLVATDFDGNQVFVLLGDGDGTFAVPVAYPTGTAPTAVALADMDGDGDLDLVIGGDAGNVVYVMAGDGAGALGGVIGLGIGDVSAYAVALSDFDGDGDTDMAFPYLGSGGGLSVLTSDGSFGVIGYPDNRNFSSQSRSIAVGDFNGDGDPDLVTANTATNVVSVMLGSTGSTFADTVEYPTGPAPAAVSVADFDGDGVDDLAVAESTGTDVDVLMGRGDGTFAAADAEAVDLSHRTVVTSDFNEDGKPDIVVGNSDGTFSILLNSMTAPNAPTGVVATGGAGQATVSFTPSTDNGGDDITGYTVTSDPGGKTCSPASLTPDGNGKLSCTVTGLTNGTAYTFTVHATNSLGDSTESGASSAVTPGRFIPGPTATITGVARIGNVLTAHKGSPSPTPAKVSYRWFANGVQIKDKTSSHLTLGSAQVGKAITVRVYVAKTGYLTVSDLSDPTGKVSGLKPKRLDLQPDEDTVRVGQKVAPVEVSGLSSGEKWTLFFDGNPIKTGTANSKGKVSTSYVVPNEPKGKHVLRVNGRFADRYDTDTLTIK